MKKTKLILASLALAATCGITTAQETKEKPAEATADSKASKEQAEMEKKWMEYATPGSMHEMLAKSNGDWNVETTVWMAPGAPPTKSSGKCNNQMVMGGRYQQSLHTGDFMGQPFEGMSMVGYDNTLKMFVTTWVDNMGTGIMSMRGTYDEKTRTVTSKGKMVDCMEGKEIDVKETMKFVDDKTQVMEMFTLKGGKEIKTMEITFTR